MRREKLRINKANKHIWLGRIVNRNGKNISNAKYVGVDALVDPKKNNNAITLIALIITIIILLILAGVTINVLIGENGLFKIASGAAKGYQKARDKRRNRNSYSRYRARRNSKWK